MVYPSVNKRLRYYNKLNRIAGALPARFYARPGRSVGSGSGKPASTRTWLDEGAASADQPGRLQAGPETERESIC